jgi:hypothetical protein
VDAARPSRVRHPHQPLILVLSTLCSSKVPPRAAKLLNSANFVTRHVVQWLSALCAKSAVGLLGGRLIGTHSLPNQLPAVIRRHPPATCPH